MGGNGLAVEILADEYEFYHAVAVFGIPVACKARLIGHKLCELVFGCTRKPEAGLGKLLLHSGLLEKIRHVGVVAEVYNALGADHIRGPMTVDEEIELVEVETLAAVVDECLYAIFLSLALVMVMMVVVMVVAVFVPVMVVLMFVVVVMVMFMLMLMMMFVMVSAGLGFFLLGGSFFYLVYPSG